MSDNPNPNPNPNPPQQSPTVQTSPQPAPQPASRPAVPPEASKPQPVKVGGFVIEDGIDIPPVGPPKKASEFADVLKALKVGQSFTLSEDKQQAVRSAAKNLGVRVAVRKAGDGKARVWRVEEAKKNEA